MSRISSVIVNLRRLLSVLVLSLHSVVKFFTTVWQISIVPRSKSTADHFKPRTSERRRPKRRASTTGILYMFSSNACSMVFASSADKNTMSFESVSVFGSLTDRAGLRSTSSRHSASLNACFTRASNLRTEAFPRPPFPSLRPWSNMAVTKFLMSKG